MGKKQREELSFVPQSNWHLMGHHRRFPEQMKLQEPACPVCVLLSARRRAGGRAGSYSRPTLSHGPGPAPSPTRTHRGGRPRNKSPLIHHHLATLTALPEIPTRLYPRPCGIFLRTRGLGSPWRMIPLAFRCQVGGTRQPGSGGREVRPIHSNGPHGIVSLKCRKLCGQVGAFHFASGDSPLNGSLQLPHP